MTGPNTADLFQRRIGDCLARSLSPGGMEMLKHRQSPDPCAQFLHTSAIQKKVCT